MRLGAQTMQKVGYDRALAKALSYGVPLVNAEGTEILLGMHDGTVMSAGPHNSVPVFRLENVSLRNLAATACDWALQASPAEVGSGLAANAVDAYLAGLADRETASQVADELNCEGVFCGWMSHEGYATNALANRLRLGDFWLVSSAEVIELDALWRSRGSAR